MTAIVQYKQGFSIPKKINTKNKFKIEIGQPMRLNEDGTISLCIENDFFGLSCDAYNPFPHFDDRFDVGGPFDGNIFILTGRSVCYIGKDLFENPKNLKAGDYVSVKDGKYIKAPNKKYYIGKIISTIEKLDDGLGNAEYGFIQVLFFETPVDKLEE